MKKIEIHALKNETTTKETVQELYEVGSSGFGGKSPWSIESLSQTLEAKNAIVFVAETEDRKIGFVAASISPYELDIYIVVVSEEYKNQKIGRQLFEAIIKYAKEKKIPEIILETRISNRPAIALYKRVGFQIVGERKAYYSSPIENAIVMKREVGEEK